MSCGKHQLNIVAYVMYFTKLKSLSHYLFSNKKTRVMKLCFEGGNINPSFLGPRRIMDPNTSPSSVSFFLLQLFPVQK